jgi:hypothetical protein
MSTSRTIKETVRLESAAKRRQIMNSPLILIRSLPAKMKQYHTFQDDEGEN